MITPATAQHNTRQAADGLLHTADQAIESTRSFANHALDKTEEKVHGLSSSVKPTLDKLSHKADQYAQQGIDMAIRAKDKARDSLTQYSDITSRYVADKPVQSVLIAAAVGAVVALLVSSARSRSRY